MQTLKRHLLLILLVTCLGSAVRLQAQSGIVHNEIGSPFITNFAPADYDADTQNWAIIEDNRGVIYVGNNSGLMEYDGVSWRLLAMPNASVVRSLAQDENGRIWVGGVNEIGFLAADSVGTTVFVSVLDKVPEEFLGFGDVWSAYGTDAGVLFLTAESLMLWDGERIRGWQSEKNLHVAALIDGSIYVRIWDVGLTRLDGYGEDASFELVPGGERFANTRIYSILPFGDGRMLVGTREEGFFLYDGETFTPFETEADDIVARGSLYLPGIVLPGGQFAFGTLSEGLVIIDREGRLVNRYDQAAGILSNYIIYPFLDRSGKMWLALGQGISRVETGSSISIYDERKGASRAPFAAASHNGILYAAPLAGGVEYLDPATNSFKPVANQSAETLAMLDLGNDLLVAAGNDGLQQIMNNTTVTVRAPVGGDYTVIALHAWSRNPDIVFTGLRQGTGVMHKTPAGWVDAGMIPGLHLESWKFEETPDGNLWVVTYTGEAARIEIPASWASGDIDFSGVEFELFGVDDGLPEGQIVTFSIDDTLFFSGSGEQILVFDEDDHRFVPDDRFDGARSGHPLSLLNMHQDEDGRVWVARTYDSPTVGEKQADGSWVFSAGPLRRLKRQRITDLLLDDDGVIWMLGENLIRYDSAREQTDHTMPPPLIRRVALGNDKILYAGNGETDAVELAYGSGSVAIAYAAPGSVGSERYRTWLEGFEAGWSNWTAATERTFTNLPPGNYTFHVEAENRGASVYTFRVLPPWYRTGWAYGFFVLLLGAGVFGVDRVQRRRLVSKERERSRLREAELRAEALQAENERKQNVELLSKIGQSITATLSVEEVIETVYENVNALMDATVFGIGIVNEESRSIDFPATKEKGQKLAAYSNSLDDDSRLAVWCVINRKEIVIGNFAEEHRNYLSGYKPPIKGEDPESVLYLPLIQQDRVIGVITTQSFEKEAYTEYELNLLRNLATYTAIALDNASAYRQLDATVGELKTTQQQLVQQEKLASLGQLTSGIAHEIKNPLNFINNFAEVNAELAQELRSEIRAGRGKKVDEVAQSLEEIAISMNTNTIQIVKHGKRADQIVKNMMEHASVESKDKYRVDFNALVDEYATLAYQGKRTQLPDLEVAFERELDPEAGTIEIVPQEFSRVLLNIVGNALDAVHERAAVAGGHYRPWVAIRTAKIGNLIELRISDNGPGIPDAIKDRIFDPFFTTKPTGTGTGLGLSLSYDIISNIPGGSLTVESEVDKGATFIISLPA